MQRQKRSTIDNPCMFMKKTIIIINTSEELQLIFRNPSTVPTSLPKQISSYQLAIRYISTDQRNNVKRRSNENHSCNSSNRGGRSAYLVQRRNLPSLPSQR
mmetsp:Transcript_19476/g.22558  ORF Transcript_19476/g.22558 Transcript_19476/m.22558 type:complete len:101 (-) Transcript_19476:922-1224(-)